MPTLLITGPARSGKTSVAGGLLVWLREAKRSAAYVKPFAADGAADADHAFAASKLADALDIAVGPAPEPPANSIDGAVQAIALLVAEADTVVVEAADDSSATDLAAALNAPVLEIHAYSAGQRLGGDSRPGGRTLGQPAGLLGGQRRAAVPPGRRGRIRMPSRRRMLTPS